MPLFHSLLQPGEGGGRAESNYEFLCWWNMPNGCKILVAKPVLLSGTCHQSVAGLDVGTEQLQSRQR